MLRKDADGRHYLVTPAEKVDVAVDDAPFLAVEMEVRGAGASQSLIFRTNVDDIVTAGPEHPLRFAIEPESGGLKPYLLVRGRLEALVTRALAYDLVEIAVAEEGQGLGLWSGGAFFPIPDGLAGLPPACAVRTWLDLPPWPAKLYGSFQAGSRPQSPAGNVIDDSLGGLHDATRIGMALRLGLRVHGCGGRRRRLGARSAGQSGPGWTVLLDDKTMGEWDKVGESQLAPGGRCGRRRQEDQQGPGPPRQQGEVQGLPVYVEFWASDDANSGIHVRCQDPD